MNLVQNQFISLKPFNFDRILYFNSLELNCIVFLQLNRSNFYFIYVFLCPVLEKAF
jgi:hypothetical protein